MSKAKTEISPVMRDLSAYIAEAVQQPLPDPIAAKGKHHLLDTIAAMISGSRLRPGEMTLRYIALQGGVEEAVVAGSGIVTSAINAALANGMLAHADETDDSHKESRSHLGCGVVPAALAMAEREASSGAALLRAVVLGYDIGARINFALDVHPFYAAGHSTHTFAPTFGAAAAAGALAGLNGDQVRWLISYTAQQASGVNCWQRDLDHIEKAFDFGGMAGRNGVTAATMVQAGFTGVDDVFIGPRNFFFTYADKAKPEALTDGLGHALRDHADQYQEMVGRLTDPGAPRLSRSDVGEAENPRRRRRAGDVAFVRSGASRGRRPAHAGYLHPAHGRHHVARWYREFRLIA